MQIMVINNGGGGFAEKMEVPDGMTVEKLLSRLENVGDPRNHLIRINRQPCVATQMLREGDRVSITPTKIEGA